jgi:beta-lactamase regulating signal transducer with metallopeptidase domain
MSNQAVTFLVSRLAVATVEFLIVGFLVAGLLVLLPQIGPRWRRRIWFLALCKPFVTVLTGFWGGFVPLAPFVNGTLLGDILFPARAGSTSLTESSASSTVIHVVAYAWMLITLAMLIRVAVRALASRQVAEDHLAKGYLLKPTTIKRLDAKLSVPPQARIIITPEEAGPATLGVFRPAVIIPESLLPWVLRHRDPTPQERDRLCQVLRHELAHIAHRDDLVTLITLVMLSFFWFHPVAHWAYRRVRMNNELCCDEDVVRSGVRPADYVDTLMGIVAGQFSRRGFSLHMIGDSAPVGVLRKRLHYVLRERRELEPRRPWAAYVMVGVMLLALPRFLGLGGLIEVTTVGGEGMLVTQAELHRMGPAHIKAVHTPGVVDASWFENLPALDAAGGPVRLAGEDRAGSAGTPKAAPTGTLPSTEESAAPLLAESDGDVTVLTDVSDEDTPAPTDSAKSKPATGRSRGPVWRGPHTRDGSGPDAPILPPRPNQR